MTVEQIARWDGDLGARAFVQRDLQVLVDRRELIAAYVITLAAVQTIVLIYPEFIQLCLISVVEIVCRALMECHLSLIGLLVALRIVVHSDFLYFEVRVLWV